MKDSQIHILQVMTAHLSAWTIFMSHVNELLTTVSLVLASAYTIYKFVKDHRSDKNT